VIWGFRNGEDTDNWALVYNYETDSFTERQWPFYAAGYLRLSRSTFLDTWNEQTDAWDDVPGTGTKSWDEFLAQSVQDYDLVTGDANGYLWDADNLLYEQANGVDIEATLESKDFDFDAPNAVKQIGGVLLDIPVDTGDNPLTLEVGTRDNLNDDITWTSPRSYSGNGRIDVRAAGRYIRFRFKKNGGHFRLREWSPLYQVRGNY
jgi:hypothetical protein